LGACLIHPNTPTRITLFDALGNPTERWTLQIPDREGRVLKIQPEATVSTGSSPHRERTLCIKGFRLLLEHQWAVDTGSLRELRLLNAMWGTTERHSTALAISSIHNASTLWPVGVEPWVGSVWSSFSAQTLSTPLKLRDRKGRCHVGLELKLEAVRPVQTILPNPFVGGAFVAPGLVEPGFVE
jgi:hypothetical protein